MSLLYPLKFDAIPVEKPWGGNELHAILNKPDNELPIGESWEISALKDRLSVVSNGVLKGKTIQDLIDNNPIQFLGKKIYDKYGSNFPLLIKFIDATQELSVQLHPDDSTAKQNHNSLGKEEMWFILHAEPNSQIILGFEQEVTAQDIREHLENKTLEKVLHKQTVKKGDVFYIPPGLVHSIGRGILLVEIQQSSDITYRLYDWDRKDANGKQRKLHIEEALDAISFDSFQPIQSFDESDDKTTKTWLKANAFKTNQMSLIAPKKVENQEQTFCIYINIGGKAKIVTAKNESVIFDYGETVLIPACIDFYALEPIDGTADLLQIFPE